MVSLFVVGVRYGNKTSARSREIGAPGVPIRGVPWSQYRYLGPAGGLRHNAHSGSHGGRFPGHEGLRFPIVHPVAAGAIVLITTSKIAW